MEEIKKAPIDSTGYKGLVEVGIIRNNKKYPKFTCNSGTLELFKFLCNCLAAKLNPDVSASVKDRPTCLNLMKSNGDYALTYGIIFSDIIIKEDEITPSCSIIFNFLVPGTSILNTEITKLELVSGNNSNIVYATASLDDALVVTQIDTNVYVSWTLTIMNK